MNKFCDSLLSLLPPEILNIILSNINDINSIVGLLENYSYGIVPLLLSQNITKITNIMDIIYYIPICILSGYTKDQSPLETRGLFNRLEYLDLTIAIEVESIEEIDMLRYFNNLKIFNLILKKKYISYDEVTNDIIYTLLAIFSNFISMVEYKNIYEEAIKNNRVKPQLDIRRNIMGLEYVKIIFTFRGRNGVIIINNKGKYYEVNYFGVQNEIIYSGAPHDFMKFQEWKHLYKGPFSILGGLFNMDDIRIRSQLLNNNNLIFRLQTSSIYNDISFINNRFKNFLKSADFKEYNEIVKNMKSIIYGYASNKLISNIIILYFIINDITNIKDIKLDYLSNFFIIDLDVDYFINSLDFIKDRVISQTLNIMDTDKILTWNQYSLSNIPTIDNNKFSVKDDTQLLEQLIENIEKSNNKSNQRVAKKIKFDDI